MSELQQILVTLTSITQQLVTSQILISDILVKDAQGISPDTRELLSKLRAEDMKRLQLLGQTGRLIAHVK